MAKLLQVEDKMIGGQGSQNAFSQMSIPRKIMMGFLIMIIPMILVGLMSFYNMSAVERELVYLFEKEFGEKGIQSSESVDLEKEIETIRLRMKHGKMVIMMIMTIALIMCIAVALFISRGLISDIEKMKGSVSGGAIDLNRIDQLLEELRSLIHACKSF